MIELRLKRAPAVPLEAEVLSPDILASLSHSEILSLTIFHGRRRCRLGDFFDLQGEKSEHLRIQGQLKKVRRIGQGMSHGSIHIDGDVGMHLGAGMKGGAIHVSGNAGDWVGAEMRNGAIHIQGNAGDRVGASYRGSSTGMKNGLISVGGSAGLEVGLKMRRGTIVVQGRAGEFAGLQMKGGTIVLARGAGDRVGAWIRRGTIISFSPLNLLATFDSCGDFSTAFLGVFERYLLGQNIQLPAPFSESKVTRHVGDKTVAGQGEILVCE